MADLQKVRVQLLDKETGAVIQEVDVLTSPSSVIFSDGKNLTEKLSEIELTPGPQGAPFQIMKIYPSVEAMNLGYAADGVKIGEFVLINTDNVADADNAKLYCKGETAYTYITDLSGAQGIVGPSGRDGINGINGKDGAIGAPGTPGKDGINGKDGDTVKVGTDYATAVERSLFFKVVS